MTILSTLRRIWRREPSRKAVLEVVERAKTREIGGWSAGKIESEIRRVKSALEKQGLAVKILERHIGRHALYALPDKKLARKNELDLVIPLLGRYEESKKRSPFDDGTWFQAGPEEPETHERKMYLNTAKQERLELRDYEANEARRAEDTLKEYLSDHRGKDAKAALAEELKNLKRLKGYHDKLIKAKASR